MKDQAHRMREWDAYEEERAMKRRMRAIALIAIVALIAVGGMSALWLSRG